MRTWFRAIAVALAAAVPGRADYVVLDQPDAYTPGTPFTVGVGLAPVSDLGAYNVELVFRTTRPVAGLLAVDPPAAAASGYVFPSPANFLAGAVASGTDYRVTLSDFGLAPTGPTVVAGVNDRLTSLTVRPAAGLTGPISVFVERSSLQIDDAAGGSLLGPGEPPSGVVAQAVPGPAAWACGATCLVALAVRRRYCARDTR